MFLIVSTSIGFQIHSNRKVLQAPKAMKRVQQLVCRNFQARVQLDQVIKKCLEEILHNHKSKHGDKLLMLNQKT